MKDRGLRLILSLFPTALFVVTAPSVITQTDPVLDQGYAGAVTVSGVGAAADGPVTVYDVSIPGPAKLGESQSVDAAGNFAVTVAPALVLGHDIVAVDANGARSQPMKVAARPGSPAGPGDSERF